jgi:hypothetical protein
VTTPRNEAAAEYRDMIDGEWTWLYDDYADGSAFITDDPIGSQSPIVEGLDPMKATQIVAAHNMLVRAILHDTEAPEGGERG